MPGPPSTESSYHVLLPGHLETQMNIPVLHSTRNNRSHAHDKPWTGPSGNPCTSTDLLLRQNFLGGRAAKRSLDTGRQWNTPKTDVVFQRDHTVRPQGKSTPSTMTPVRGHSKDAPTTTMQERQPREHLSPRGGCQPNTATQRFCPPIA